jgi:hypothetical protein
MEVDSEAVIPWRKYAADDTGREGGDERGGVPSAQSRVPSDGYPPEVVSSPHERFES